MDHLACCNVISVLASYKERKHVVCIICREQRFHFYVPETSLDYREDIAGLQGKKIAGHATTEIDYHLNKKIVVN